MTFKEEYDKAKTLADVDNLLENTDRNTLVALQGALEVVEDFTSLDMKQLVLLRYLRAFLKFN